MENTSTTVFKSNFPIFIVLVQSLIVFFSQTIVKASHLIFGHLHLSLFIY